MGEDVKWNIFCGCFVGDEATGDGVVFTTGDAVGTEVVAPVGGATVVWVAVGVEVDEVSSSLFLVGENVFTVDDVGECVLIFSFSVGSAIVGDEVESATDFVVVGESVN